jgi:uncharacterized repeat protein (TIGR03806 family)
MRTLTLLLAFSAAILAGWLLCDGRAADPVKKDDAKPVGIDQRVPWTTSRVKGSPEPPPEYRSEVAFPKLKFSEPLDMAAVPGRNRLAVAERNDKDGKPSGKIWTFPADPARAEKADLLLDLKTVVYAIAFHPQFATNGYFYVTYIAHPDKEEPTGTKVARYQAKGEPPVADPASAKIIFEWPSGGHNAGCLKFGPDGYLYIGCGDGSGIADQLQTGQDISDVLSSILRIDVDHPDAGKAYGIPKDNPFVGTQGARPEVWAYGLRQPWKFSFDRKTGDLWCGDVGQDLWEMVYRVEKGGNYGWSVMEGSHPFRPERKKGPTPILPPVVEHPHSEFRSLTGGYLYRGERLKELTGTYIYGDFDTGRIWGFRYDGKKVSEHRELAKTKQRVVSFGQDEAGELYYLDFVGGQVHRLAPAPKAIANADFPKKLSETGLFASTKDHKPEKGLIPYTVNAPLWSDGLLKDRFLALPGESKIDFDAIVYPQPAPGAPPGWRFPDGTVLVKTFSLETEVGHPASRRRLETRILHYQEIPGADEYGEGYWRGYTYLWDDDQSDAVLLEGSLDRTYTVKDKDAPGGERKQTWHFPSRAECTLCHTLPAKFVLGVNTLQFNREHDYGGRVANQLRTLEHLGAFSKPLPAAPEKLPRLASYEAESLPVEERARSYLHSNCAHCHMKWGGGNAEFQLLATLPLKDTGTINTRPGQGTFDLNDPRILVPGDPERSLVLYRMKKTGLGRMPHVGSNVVDEKAVRLVAQWIKQLPK